MVELFLSGGVLMWPLLLVGLGVLALAIRVVLLLRGGESAPGDAERSLQTMLFWGVMGAVLGLIGTAAGLIQMARWIETFGPVQDTLVRGGVGVALVTVVFGMAILLVALLLWLGLRPPVLRRSARIGARPSAA
jgi:biopolymer transport protein ExbB/TolQ